MPSEYRRSMDEILALDIAPLSEPFLEGFRKWEAGGDGRSYGESKPIR